MNSQLLSLAIWVPILGAVLVFAVGSERRTLVRWLALAVAIAGFLVTIPLYTRFDATQSGMQFVEQLPWITRFNVWYLLGVDGISMPFILLNSLITVFVVLAGWEVIEEKQAQYMGAFLAMSGLMNGIFSALDGVLFYVFFEASLIPMYIIIGVWGGPNRVYAAIKFFLYTLLGSLLMLVALIWLFLESGGSFSILDWHQLPIGIKPQILIFIAFLVSFAVKVPMWPVHTWLPDAHVEAPTGGSVVLAAIALKLGAYGFVRFSLPIVPDASHTLAPMMIALSLIAVVYIGFVALVQADMKKLIAYSSISHMGFVTLGFFIFNQIGVEGALVQMISHGFISAAMFPLRRRHVRPHALAHDRRLRRRGAHHAEVRRAVRLLRHGQFRPACDLRVRRRVHGHPRCDQDEFLAWLRRRDDADPRRRLYPVDDQARGLRTGRQPARRRTAGHRRPRIPGARPARALRPADGRLPLPLHRGDARLRGQPAQACCAEQALKAREQRCFRIS
jgi:proton-translocating NADH-quinone oxidoreductase chain M